MNRVVLKSRVGRDGGLHLDVPAGSFAADDEVQVTIESVEPGSSGETTLQKVLGRMAALDRIREERRLRLLSLAGRWKGPFLRPDQGEDEVRGEFS